MSAPERRRRQVHRGVAGLEVGGGGGAEQKEPREEERNRSPRRREQDDDRAGCGDEIQQRQAGPPPAPVDDGRGRDGKESSPHDCGALRQTRYADTCDVGRQQCSHRRADRHTDAADDLGNEQEAQCALLNGGYIHGTNSMKPDLERQRVKESRVASRWSLVTSRWSLVAGRWSVVARRSRETNTRD